MAAELHHIPPVLVSSRGSKQADKSTFYDVPRLFCAGDSNQSIYGWRGAAPRLSMEGFRSDFPQGIVKQLDTSFRLPDDVWRTIAPMTGAEVTTTTFPASPVGESRCKEIVSQTLDQYGDRGDLIPSKDSLSKILSDELTDDTSVSNIHVQGVWDAREEAKYIATMIRRRSLERIDQITSAVKMLGEKPEAQIKDPTHVAVLFRAGRDMKLFQEVLRNAGVPYVLCDGERQNTTPLSKTNRKTVHMRPVVLMTMHRAKGEEFDDVYLPGWTEGVFPHPTAVSSNRVDEERRLAYVALSRARHRIVVTHSFVRRTLHGGPELGTKYVTMQVLPSRFLYELVPDAIQGTSDVVDNSNVINERKDSNNNVPSIIWNRARGTKEMFAGSQLPQYFQKSYQVPKHFQNLEQQNQPDLPVRRTESSTNTLVSKKKAEQRKHKSRGSKLKESMKRAVSKLVEHDKKKDTRPSLKVLTPKKLTGDEINRVVDGLNHILSGARATKYASLFREILQENFGLQRGRIALFAREKELRELTMIDVKSDVHQLFESEPTGSRPLSQATAFQLGLYLLHLLGQ